MAWYGMVKLSTETGGRSPPVSPVRPSHQTCIQKMEVGQIGHMGTPWVWYLQRYSFGGPCSRLSVLGEYE